MSKKYLLKLPKELLNEIFNYLTIEDLLLLFISCRKINNLSKNNTIEYSSAIQIYKYYLNLYNENTILQKWIRKFPPANRQTHLIDLIMGGLLYSLFLTVSSFLIPLLLPEKSVELRLKMAMLASTCGILMALAVLLISTFFINDLRIEYFIMKHFRKAENQIFFYKTDARNSYFIGEFYFNEYNINIAELTLKLNSIEETLMRILAAINKEREFISKKYKFLETKSNFFKNKPLDYQNPSEIRKPQLSNLDYANVSLYRYLENKYKGSLPKLFNAK